MSVKYENVEFGRQGKGVNALPEAEQKFIAKQLTEDSISGESVDKFLEDVMEVCGGDFKVAAEQYRAGANRWLKQQAGETDEASKFARQAFKLGVTLGTNSPSELAQAIRDGRLKVSV